MIERKTLFIVGAGASREVGLPTGPELLKTIAPLVDIRLKLGEQLSGDHEIFDALKCHDGKNVNAYCEAGRHIATSMPLAMSIDGFIDSHRGNEKIELCGKLAIVKAILRAEEKSHLFFDITKRDAKMDFSRLHETWFDCFQKLLFEQCHQSELEQRLRGISFIVFNYDRCIEHFLFHALSAYYQMHESTAVDLVRCLNIEHPYGLVGTLPWLAPGRRGTSFGINELTLLQLAKQIKTYAEQVVDEQAVDRMRRFVSQAEIIVFLGFAFHRQNMTLLKPKKCAVEKKKVFVTNFGISASDCNVVRQQIHAFLPISEENIEIKMGTQLTCYGLFREYWRSLALS